MRQILLVAVFCSAALAEIPMTARVGQPVLLIDIYIPGGEVKPLPRRDRTPPIVVRLLETKPAQDGFRYDFEITALDPGKHQLADYLSAVDPAVPPELPDILLDVSSGLPPGLVLPHEQPEAELPELGGYRTKMTVAAAAWLAGLIGIIVWKRRKSDVQSEDPAAPGLAERL